MGLTPLKRALVSGGLSMTYKVHNPGAPRDVGLNNTPSQSQKLTGTKRGANLTT